MPLSSSVRPLRLLSRLSSRSLTTALSRHPSTHTLSTPSAPSGSPLFPLSSQPGLVAVSSSSSTFSTASASSSSSASLPLFRHTQAHPPSPLRIAPPQRSANKRSGPDADFNILAGQDEKPPITHLRRGGFVVNGYNINGSVALFHGTFLKWNVAKVEDITEASLALFALLNPRPEILVIGTGDQLSRLAPTATQHLRSLGILLEIQPSAKASATYNFFVQEGRVTAAALLPPTNV